MFGIYRYDAIVFLLLSVLVLEGCGQHTAANSVMPSINATKPVVLLFSLNTPVEKIAADRRGKAVLERDLPGLLSNPRYLLFNDMSLSQIAALSCGRLTEAKLDQVQADLSRLPN